jgi:hypothetical protein
MLLLLCTLARADVPSTPEPSCRCSAATPMALAPLVIAAALPTLLRRRR